VASNAEELAGAFGCEALSSIPINSAEISCYIYMTVKPTRKSVIKEEEYRSVYKTITNWEQKFLEIRSIENKN